MVRKAVLLLLTALMLTGFLGAVQEQPVARASQTGDRGLRSRAGDRRVDSLVPSQNTWPQAGVMHVVETGETMFSIAERYGVTVEAIARANGIPDPRQISIGQQLLIPGVEEGEGEEGARAHTVSYLVRAGDTLSGIARRHHTTWRTVAQLNGILAPHTLYPGQVIRVPGRDGGRSILEGELTLVRPADILLRVALRSDVSPWTIVRLSRIHSPALWYPGQQVLIPGEGEGYLAAPFRSIAVQPLPVEQGNTLAVSVQTTQPVSLEGRLFEERVQFSEDVGTYHALVGVHVFTEPGLYELSLRAVDDAGQRTRVTTGVVIEEGWFGYERIDLPSTTDSLLEPEVIAAERERIEALRTTYTAERHWSVPFQRPCEGPISSYFGTHRAYNTGPYTSYHSGVDFRAPGGTPVYAPAGGVVLLADGLNVRGNAIIVDHGWGVVSGYWHLSAIEVEPGQRVERGQQIGRVGNTGLSTGAHLHWQMWVGGVSVNGLPWLDESSPLASPEDQSPGD